MNDTSVTTLGSTAQSLLDQHLSAARENARLGDQALDFSSLGTKSLFSGVSAVALGVGAAVVAKTLGAAPAEASILGNAAMMSALTVGALAGGVLGWVGSRKMSQDVSSDAALAAQSLAIADAQIDAFLARSDAKDFRSLIQERRAANLALAQQEVEQNNREDQEGVIAAVKIGGLGLVTPGAVKDLPKLFKSRPS